MIRWADKQPRMRRGGGLFCLGDVVPEGYFTGAEIADLTARGKVTVEVEQTIVEELYHAEDLDQTEDLDQPVEIGELKALVEQLEKSEVDLGGDESKKHSVKRRVRR